MIKCFATCDTHGAIEQIITCDASLKKHQGGEGALVVEVSETVDGATHYIDLHSEQVVEKQPLNLPESLQITADGTDEAVLTNIPAGVTVQWPDGETDEVTDGEVCFAVDLPGTYTLIFDAVPYLRQEVTIEAVAAT